MRRCICSTCLSVKCAEVGPSPPNPRMQACLMRLQLPSTLCCMLCVSRSLDCCQSLLQVSLEGGLHLTPTRTQGIQGPNTLTQQRQQQLLLQQ